MATVAMMKRDYDLGKLDDPPPGWSPVIEPWSLLSDATRRLIWLDYFNRHDDWINRL